MSGPIQTITLDSNTPEPPNHNYLVTITVPVWINDIPEGVTIEQAAELMAISRWEEGRYPFDDELLHEGLRRVVEYAFREALGNLLRKKYGRETVPYVSELGNRGEQARWFEEIQKIKGPYVSVSDRIKTAKIEQRCGKCHGDGTVTNWTNVYKKEPCDKCGGKGIEKTVKTPRKPVINE